MDGGSALLSPVAFALAAHTILYVCKYTFHFICYSCKHRESRGDWSLVAVSFNVFHLFGVALLLYFVCCQTTTIEGDVTVGYFKRGYFHLCFQSSPKTNHLLHNIFIVLNILQRLNSRTSLRRLLLYRQDRNPPTHKQEYKFLIDMWIHLMCRFTVFCHCHSIFTIPYCSNKLRKA